MLASVAAFEFRYQLKNPVFWIAAGLFFLAGFGLIAGSTEIGGAGGNTHANSPYSLLQVQALVSIFYMFVTTAFVANVVVRDDETGFGPLIHSTRITRPDYLGGRFLGAFAVAAVAFLAVPLGQWLGSLMPWVDAQALGPNHAAYYLWPYLALALPNILVTSAIFFALATVSRSMMATYLGVVAFIILWIIANTSLAGIRELRDLLPLIDPFGILAVNRATSYWTVTERNSALVALEGAVLWNRLTWIAVAAALVALAHLVYGFRTGGNVSRAARKAARGETLADAPGPGLAPLPHPRQGGSPARAQLLARTRFEAGLVLRSPAFAFLMLLGVINSAAALWFGGVQYGTPFYPVTYLVIGLLKSVFSVVLMLIAVYYAGEVVWRERERRIHEIIGAAPLPGWAFAVPKILAVALVLIAAVLVAAATGVLVQLIKGYTRLELDHYLLWYLLPESFDMIVLAVLAIFAQVASPSKFVGWGLMLLYFVAGIMLPKLGFGQHLWVYGSAPGEPLSDMNGAGIYWIAAWWYRLVWGAVALVLAVLAHLLWQRGAAQRLRPRLRTAIAGLRGTPGVIAGAGAVTAIVAGGWILYNTNVLNYSPDPATLERIRVAYEKKYIGLDTAPQPTVTHIRLVVGIRPMLPSAVSRGELVLTNRTQVPISDLHVGLTDLDVSRVRLLAMAVPGARLVDDDVPSRHRVYRFNTPMAPGETRTLSFTIWRGQVGFRNGDGETSIVPNGTFVMTDALVPNIGLARNFLIEDAATRRRNGLPPLPRMPRLEDDAAAMRPTYRGGMATADVTVTTDADQVPIAPGRKVFDHVEAGRRTARFVSDTPLQDIFAIQSARYAAAFRKEGPVQLGVYYHPAHGWNVGRMLNALRVALDYYGHAFGPYQFDQARVVEFPAYRNFAVSFPNTIPYSESMGFIADNADPARIDAVTYVTAHELAHQWWGHQLNPAAVQGGTMLSETLSQYSALMVMKRIYGPDQIRRFLKYELDAYLAGRAGEKKEELPLYRVEDQQYIHYRKGAVVMYLLQERLGEAAVNRALAQLIQRFGMKGAPYARTSDLIALLRKEARTPEQQALITDLLERITLYDLKVERASAKPRADGRWDVEVLVDAHKFYADGLGVQRETRINEAIELGLFTATPGEGRFDRANVVVMERRPVRSGRQLVRFITAKRPTRAGIDPYNFYIDRNSSDNLAPVN